MEEGLPPTP
jgi:hypothetical protein